MDIEFLKDDTKYCDPFDDLIKFFDSSVCLYDYIEFDWGGSYKLDLYAGLG